MDLHIVDIAATAAERAAIDTVLDPVVGPVRGGWDGGERDIEKDGRVARGGHDARSHRDMLLPALHAAQDTSGWISPAALAYICRRLTVPPAEAYGVASFYALLATTPMPPAVAPVCDDMACRLAGAEVVCANLERELGPAGEPAPGATMTWKRSPCLGQCERAPAAMFTVAGDPPVRRSIGPIDAAGVIAHLDAGL
ncbi:MAG: NAD(P)H-dependent oxidoreductase subunit E, partial [Chloroflexi bacterium]|nr:NAD(P)H-dependent oxidoreductase subunit E [Chloroflexota bacterium]